MQGNVAVVAAAVRSYFWKLGSRPSDHNVVNFLGCFRKKRIRNILQSSVYGTTDQSVFLHPLQQSRLIKGYCPEIILILQQRLGGRHLPPVERLFSEFLGYQEHIQIATEIECLAPILEALAPCWNDILDWIPDTITE